MNRTNFRPRQIDYSKPLQLITDINEVSKKEDSASLNWVITSHNDDKKASISLVEYEKQRIIELFSKKKTIEIPRVEKVDKKDIKPEQNGEGKFSTISNYKQYEYTRPKHYIVYSQKNVLEPKGKDYEATIYDFNFLKFENYFISVDELERIISALENDINKGEMIPQDRIKEIILSVVPDKKQHADKIAKVSLSYLISILNFNMLLNINNSLSNL